MPEFPDGGQWSSYPGYHKQKQSAHPDDERSNNGADDKQNLLPHGELTFVLADMVRRRARVLTYASFPSRVLAYL